MPSVGRVFIQWTYENVSGRNAEEIRMDGKSNNKKGNINDTI